MSVHPIYSRTERWFSFEKVANMPVILRVLMTIFLIIPYMSWMFFADIFRYLWVGNREHEVYPWITATLYHAGFTFFVIWLLWKDPFDILVSGPGFLGLLHNSFSILTPLISFVDKFLPSSLFLAGYKWLCGFFAYHGAISILHYFIFYVFSGFFIVFFMFIVMTIYFPLILIGILMDSISGRMPIRDVVWDSITYLKNTFYWNVIFLKDYFTLREYTNNEDYTLYDNGEDWDNDSDAADFDAEQADENAAVIPEEKPVLENKAKAEKAKPQGSFSESTEEARAKLDRMIGLQEVKDEINTLLNTQIIHQARMDSGLKSTNVLSHMVFVGNPGTGKTTVARILGDIYRNMGLLRTGVVVETARQQLVGAYIGETALKTEAVVKTALGGILFIDEAYTLAKKESANDFGQEAIDTILKMMEDHRGEFIVIVAGYPDEMQRFITSNPGLRSRFQTVIHFNDYTSADLRKIFVLNAKADDYIPSNGCMKIVSEYLDTKRAEDPETFANGRDVRNIYQQIVKEQSNRLVREGFEDKSSLQLLKTEDAQAAVNVLSGQLF